MSMTRCRSPDGATDAPNKRVKVEPEMRAPPTIGERCKELWFDDGNVIIAARGMGSEMSFRVHAGVLKLHSQAFAALVNGAALADTLEGCPVVRVEDRGHGFRDLLKIFYHGGTSSWLDFSTIAYADFRAVVDVAVKYDVKQVLQEARRRLTRLFDAEDFWSWSVELEGYNTSSLRLEDADYIDVLRVARLLHLPSVLPLVFYACCIMPVERLVDGVRYGAETIHLSAADLRACLSGRDVLVDESAELYRHLLDQTLYGDSKRPCNSHTRCSDTLRKLAIAAFDAGWHCRPAALHPVDRWLDEQRVAGNVLCKHCNRALRGAINAQRKTTWDRLGDIFGVAEWPASRLDPSRSPGSP